MLLKEIGFYKIDSGNPNTDMEMRIRCEACASVTARLMARVFKEEDAEEIQGLIKEAQESDENELLTNINELVSQMKYPN